MRPAPVLLADDDPADLSALAAALAHPGWELVRAAAGDEAVRLAADREFAVALLGLRPPGVFEAARRIRATPGAAATPVVFLAAAGAAADPVGEADGPGAVDYLVKPVPPAVLRARVAVFVELYRKTGQVRELAEADRRKDEFLALVAHELRNPLAPILNALEIVRLAGGELSPPVQKALGVVGRQAGQLVRLADDLIDVSRLTRGKVELRRAVIDLREVVREAAEAGRPALAAARHELAVDLAADPVWVDGDPDRLRRVVANLLDHAAKDTPAGGRVRVAAGREGGEAVVRVADTGEGFAPEVLPRVFDLVARAEASPGRSRVGLGVGLAVAKGLVELHGGVVSAHSEGPGRGSEFVVRLPAAAPGR